ncbi:hypothetical protein N39L_17390 [Limnospira platensis NIES-39]|jgi:hypothetical protein|uniref:Uncharacterized protein n=3 Tax=Limnospira TaxID=2596745 RepID=A0A9P1KD76_9CYAN|nr:hypothetical protein AmaxDRAFT_0408 [Limnospira maxima CS-328]UWU50092.1 hypothetical protein APLC1_4976 [Arthrospira platensis C1]CDM93849.1 conserved protein of unknown function [Limnospira indica PCC 8005]BDT12016.1 hypothetical protein N39L_17390 [Arthrospira platensis NIES-39]GCE96932.1 hypothetical protein NIES46_50070 [Arthrospira platensis NIES-46]
MGNYHVRFCMGGGEGDFSLDTTKLRQFPYFGGTKGHHQSNS